MKKRILALVLAMIMVVASLAACGGSDSSTTTAAPQDPTVATTGGDSELSNLGLTFATNDFGQGEYSLDINSWIIESVAKHVGSSVDVVDNQFTVDNIITMLRSQLSKSPDGVCMIGIAETVYPAIQQACNEANVPYSFFATPPVEEDVAAMEDDELYAGTVLFEPELEAAYLAEKAFEAGGRKAVILAGAQGDYNHDHRVTGFTQRFEELGGKVLGYSRCDNPGQGDEKGSNLLSANMDADCAIGMGAGYITSLEGVRDKLGLGYKIYGCDTTPNLIQDVIDGKVEIISCGANTGAAYATILLINKILGHPILDERGKAPFTKALSLYYCDADNCEKFQKFWDEKQRDPLTAEEIMALIGPDVSYDDFIKALENHAEDTYAKIEAYGEGGNSETPAPAGSGSAGEKKIAFTLPSLGNDFMVAVSGAMKAAVEAQGCTMQIDSADGDITKQIEQVENYAQMGFDAVVVWPVNSEGLSNIVKRVEGEGVQVLGFTNVIEGATAAMVAADERGMGEAEGELAGEWLDKTFPDAKDGEVKVLFIQSTSSPEAVARSEGLLTLADNNKKINPIIEQVDWNDPIAARNVVENALLVNNDIKLICAINGTTGIAANSYVMSANSPVSDKEHFAIFCVDDTEEIDAAILASENNESVLRGTVSMGTIQDTVNDFMKAMQPFIDGGSIVDVYGSAFRVTPDTLK